MLVDGALAGYVAKGVRIDTGADRTVVRRDFVPANAYTDRTIRLDSWRGGQPSTHQLARIKVKVGNAVADCEVAVVDKLECPALLGVDLGKEFMHAMLTNFLAQTSQDAVVHESRATVQVSPVLPSKEMEYLGGG